MPSVVVRRTIDLLETILRWLDLVGCVLCGIASNVSQEDRRIRKKLPELAVGDEEGTKGAQAV
jgi:hypothetical protein